MYMVWASEVSIPARAFLTGPSQEGHACDRFEYTALLDTAGDTNSICLCFIVNDLKTSQ